MTEAGESSEVWKRFTPASIRLELCIARVWRDGRGGQCTKAMVGDEALCRPHLTELETRGYLSHGRCDEAIPDTKLQEFLRAESNRIREERGGQPDEILESRDSDLDPRFFSESQFKRRKRVTPQRPVYLCQDGSVSASPPPRGSANLAWSVEDIREASRRAKVDAARRNAGNDRRLQTPDVGRPSPVVCDPTPVGADLTSNVEDQTPDVACPSPVVCDPTPVGADLASKVEDQTFDVAGPSPVVCDPTPVGADLPSNVEVVSEFDAASRNGGRSVTTQV